MTDFVKRIFMPKKPDYPVQSLMDVDFYKFPMGQYHMIHHPNDVVTFGLFSRNKKIPFMEVIDRTELIDSMNHVMSLEFQKTGTSYLRGMDIYGANMFVEKYIELLKNFRLPPWKLEESGPYPITFTGLAPYVSHWETLGVSVVYELYFRALMRKMTPIQATIMYSRATDKLYRKLQRLARHPGVTFVDFGSRRRHSFLWQKKAIEMAQEVMGKRFLGTSDTLLAMEMNLEPKGTNAHELPMIEAALANTVEELKAAQYKVLERWQALYSYNLRICLPDTFGTTQFLKNAPDFVADWKGGRQDSGHPIIKGWEMINWFKSKGVDLKKKLHLPSDGLDDGLMINLHDEFSPTIPTSFGWGTMFTNDFVGCFPDGDDLVPGLNLTWNEAFRAFSLVCKVVSVNGRSAVKLSDNIEKATGETSEVERYEKVFGESGRTSEEVVV